MDNFRRNKESLLNEKFGKNNFAGNQKKSSL
nr:MAG TPA: hypothetical protein [Caudoviricetes sp.]